MRRIDERTAQRQFLRLLDEVADGEMITITRRGRDFALLRQSRVPVARTTITDAIAALRAFGRAHPLGDISLRELIDDRVR